MGSVKLAGLFLASLVTALGVLLAQTGQGATISPPLDIDGLDRNLAGAGPGTELALIDVLRCEECEQDSAAPTLALAALDESTLLARQLDEFTVPLLRIDGKAVGYLDPQQIESAAKTLTR
ncbi:MAG: hypothetical protein LKM32_12870 [Chiayiivirga sp.]|jgi:hypothetical protein|uniref:hypothetical protein n=1 Tax=Chiayiivirga sp. TaxID=2041042 RepID=UPI0025C6007E|nr:hypothetical protein [Chiayiivirga sp.]MCI1730231.1 hypothetical protein [Chiayiivirga sp.]